MKDRCAAGPDGIEIAVADMPTPLVRWLLQHIGELRPRTGCPREVFAERLKIELLIRELGL